MPILREDTHAITVSIDGVSTGTWDKLSGGEVDSEETTYRPGNMSPQISLGGSSSTGNVTVSRGYDAVRDDIHGWSARAGAARVIVMAQMLDSDKNPYGRPRGYQGTLKQVTPPDLDSEGNDAALVELEITVDGGIL